MKILLVEDDKKISNFIAKGLKEENFCVDQVYNAEDGLYLIECGKEYSVILLDWMLPNMDGLTLLRKIRDMGYKLPIMMVSAKGKIEDRVLSLNSGADDYISKPFAFSELVARVKSLRRRVYYSSEELIKYNDLVLDLNSMEVKIDNKTVELTKKEFMLLKFFLENKNKTVTNTMILEHIWGSYKIEHSNTINVTIYNLRKKINSKDKNLIKTVRGIGYKLSNE